MGMDVYGRKPTAPAGEYFRANVWSWRPIHALIYELCSDLLDEQTLEEMGSNGGAGPDSQEVCTQMASRFENWLEHHVDGHEVDLGVYVDGGHRIYTEESPPKDPTTELKTAHEVNDDHLKEWVEFLRHCGGFEVW